MASNQRDQQKIRNFLDSIKGSHKVNETLPDSSEKRKSNIQIITKNDDQDDGEIKSLDMVNLGVEKIFFKNRTKLMPSHSADFTDAYIDNVLNCKERRASWTNIKSEKTKTRSYRPSLTVICK